MTARYFAYGSNLKLARMRDRIAEASSLGIAQLPGYRLVWDKRGSDGSGKANLRRDPEALVWGVLYRFESHRWPDLDRYEPEYERLRVQVLWDGAEIPVETYCSQRRTGEPPLVWYRRLVIEGAREHGLPESWVSRLADGPLRNEPEPGA